jgi:hypothetical protein
VASDAIVLVAVKSDYPEDIEHHIINKDNAEVYAKYPNWRACIPSGKDYKPYHIDTARFDAFVKERRAAWKAGTGKGTKWQGVWAVKVGPAYFKAEKFSLFLAGMKEIGATEIFVREGRRPAYAKTDKGCVLVFPILLERTEDDPDTLSLAR